MRLGLLSAAMLVSSSVFATTTPKTVLHVPLFVEVSSGNPMSPTYDYVPVSEVNKTLVAKGQAAQQEFVDLDETTKFDSFAVGEALEAAIEAAGLKKMVSGGELTPASHSAGDIKTCYRGDASGVLAIVENNTDNLYSDQYTFLGMRIGSKTQLSDSVSEGDDGEKYLTEGSEAWAKYDTSSDDVLILASVGDDGDDIQESLIPRCK